MAAEHEQRVADIVEAALEKELGDCASFLDVACVDDSALRKEVESLLYFREQATGFIEEPVASSAVELFAETLEDDRAGQSFGAYQVVREIGRGGLGAVYLAARSDDEFRKEVALKVIRRGLDTDDILRRFRLERQILAQLEHPNIARLLDGGTTDDALPFFVMEHIQGEPINAYCDSRHLGLTARLELFRKVCAAVSYAHQNLVIHRDLKPSNILVTAEGEPKLLDFGIAKVLTPEGDFVTRTIPALRVMTPEYASPEQVRGEAMTTASDVYSLGVILYELLAGGKPYRLTTHQADEVSRAISTQEPIRPSVALRGASFQLAGSRDLKSRATSLKGDLDNIILMALRKEPQRRYPSVERFSEDIRRHLAGLPVEARHDTFAYRAQKFVQRNKTGVAAAAIVFVTLVAGIVVTLFQAERVVAERNRARKEAAKASRINTFLQDVLAFSNPSWQSSNPNLTRDPTVADALKIAGERAESQLADQPEVLAAVQDTLGRTYTGRGKLDLAERFLRAALETRLRVLGPDDQDTAQSMTSLGEVFLWRADYAEAERLSRSALAIYRRAQKKAEDDAKWMAITLNNLAFAVSAGKKGQDEAEALYREAAELGAEFTGMDRAALANIYNNLSLIRFEKGDLDGALAYMEKSIAEQKSLPGDTRLDLGTKLGNLGRFLTKKGDYAEGEKYYREALETQIATVGEFHQRTAQIWASYAENLREQGDYARALKEAQHAITIQERVLAPDHVDFANAWQILGETLARAGKLEEGEHHLRRALERGSPKWPKGSRYLAQAQLALGENLQAQERLAEAEPLLRAAYEGFKERLGPEHPDTARAAERWRKLEQARASR